MVRALLTALLLALTVGCALPRAERPGVQPTLQLHDAVIDRDTTWSGSILIDGRVKVYKGVTLTILPGSDIAFVRRDEDRDGLGDGTLIVEGELHAVGTRTKPIRFRSAAPDPRPGDWLEILVDFSRATVLRYCDIRDSAHTLHAHFTRGTIEDCHIHHNLDGCRLGQGNFILRHNLIEDNEGKGINFRNSTIEISHNIIRRNGAGIFLFETDRPPLIQANNLYANGDNLRLGDFYHSDLAVGENWWGTKDPTAVAATIYDRNEDATLGRVQAEIAPAWLAGSGPRAAVTLQPLWSAATAGFVDAPPLPLDQGLLAAGWDGVVRVLEDDGTARWSTDLGETIDAPLVTDRQRVYGQHWGREVFALQLRDGAKLWRFAYPPSPADDHRQGGVVLASGLLLVPAWNGTLYGLDPLTGQERWRFSSPGPLRAAPQYDDTAIYLAGGDGKLYALDFQGRLRWSFTAAAPLLTPPVLTAAGVVILDRNGTVSSVTRNGELLWRNALESPCYYAAPAATDTALYIATVTGELWQLDPATGRAIWRQSGLGPVYATPLLADDLVIVGDNLGQLSVFGRDSGDLLAVMQLGGAIQGGPTRVGSAVAFGSRDHSVHLVRLGDSPLPP